MAHLQRFKRRKKASYTTINNTIIKDKRVSLKAKGLFVTVMSLPDDWDFSIDGMAKVLKEGRDAIRSCIMELEQNGYVTRVEFRTTYGTFDCEYTFEETPDPKAFNRSTALDSPTR
jgi:hypothetical protein